MEPEVTVNLTAVGPDIVQFCFEQDHFNQIMKVTPSVMCVLLVYTFPVLLSVVTTCGNLLVIISIIYFRQLHTPTNYLIVSLAVTDLLVGIIVGPFTIAFPMSSCMYSKSFCKVRGIFDMSLTLCSIMNLGCISIDRYWAVCHPLTHKTKINDRLVVIMILVSWGFSALTAMSAMISEFNTGKCDETCGTAVVLENSVIIIENIEPYIVSFYVSVITIIGILCIYLKIFIVAQRQVHSIQNTTCQSRKSGATVSKMGRKSTKTLAIVLGVFLLCWTPLLLCNTISYSTPIPVIEMLNWLALSNSMLNPFIYAFFYSWFRAALKMIISGKIFQGDLTNSQLH